MSLPNFNINPYVQPYVGNVNNEFANTLDHRLKQFDAVQEQDDALSFANDTLKQHILQHPNDVGYANQIMHEVRTTLADRATKGDYENMGRQVKKSAREFQAKIEPLLQRKQQYKDYVNSLSKLDKVDEDTKRKALIYSEKTDKGIDPNNIEDSKFNGFIPSNSVNLGEELDKFYQGWKADKGSRDIIQPDGTIKKISWEKAQKGENGLSGAQIMKEAGTSYLTSRADIRNYLQTQKTIGNEDRLDKELIGAVDSNMQKHYFNEYNDNIGFTPDNWMEKNKEPQFISAPSAVGDNIHSTNVFKGAKLATNGNLISNTDQYFEADQDGTYHKYVDEKGNIIPLSTAKFNEQNNTNDQESAFTKDKFRRVDANPQEQKKYTNMVNQKFDQLEAETYADDYAPNNLSPEERISYAKDRLNSMSSKERATYRNEVKDRYDQAQELNKKVETSQYVKQKATNIKTVGDSEAIGDSGVLTGSLAGRNIQLLNSPKGIDVKLQNGSDINELYSQLGSKWKVEKVVDDGWLKGNPVDSNPASAVTLHLKNSDGEQRDLKIAVGIGKADQVPALQYGQNVMSQIFSGNSDFVPAKDKNGNLTKAGYYIQSTPAKKGSNGKLQEGSQVNRTTVIEYDDEGKPTGVILPADAFYDYYISNNPRAKKELSNFIINK